MSKEELSQRIVDHIDIVNDPIADYRYKETEDPSKITVNRTNPSRGPLKDTWKTDLKNENIPLMCAYKIVKVKFEVWGLQTKVEACAQKVNIYRNGLRTSVASKVQFLTLIHNT